MEKVLKYPLSTVPFSLASSDGYPLKTNKSVLLHKNQQYYEEQDLSKLPNSVFIIDGNALFHSILDIPTTFGELAKKIFSCLPKSSTIHFVTDTYRDNSIKRAERERRGSSESNEYMLRGPATKVPRNWKAFLSNDENKKP